MDRAEVVYTLRARAEELDESSSGEEPCLWPIKLDGAAQKLAENLFAAIEISDVDAIVEIQEAFHPTSTKHESIIDVRRSLRNNEFPLFVASGVGSPTVVQLLLDSGCNACALTDTGESALDAAVVLGNTEIVEILLRSGCQRLAQRRNGEGLTILDEVLDDILTDSRPSEALVDTAVLLFEYGVVPAGNIFLEQVGDHDSIPPKLLSWLEAQPREEHADVLSTMQEMLVESEKSQTPASSATLRTSPNKKRALSPQKERRKLQADGTVLEPHPPDSKPLSSQRIAS